MIDSRWTISLDISQSNSPTAVTCKQEDTGRVLSISLSDGGYPYEITPDCYAVFTAEKPDGTILHNPCQIDGNTILYVFTQQTCAVPGKVIAEIKLYGKEDKLLTSASFLIYVDKTVFRNGDPVVSETEVSTLTHLISETASLKQELEDGLESGAFLGSDGKSAYQYAVEAGYTGTEEAFAKKLAGGDVEINLYDSAQNTERSKYDTSGAVAQEYGWYRTSDMNLQGEATFLYGGLVKTAASTGARSVFKDGNGNVVSVFLPLTGDQVCEVPDGAVSVSFTLHMNDVETFYAKILSRQEGTGPRGPKGDTGADGKSAYQYAVEAGYTGTEEAFARKLAGGDVEINLYAPETNTERSKYDTSGAVVTEYGWYRTADMNLQGEATFLYGGLDKTAAATGARSVFKDGEGNVVSVFLPLSGDQVCQVPDGAETVSFTLHMNDVDTFYAKIVTSVVETGPQGPKGDTGADGKSAYQYAVEAGYTGTEEAFSQKLAGGSVETNLYDPTQNTERSKYDTSGAVVEEYGWYRTSDMNLNGYPSFVYGGLDKTAAATGARSVFLDGEGNVVSVFLPLTGENVCAVPDNAVTVSFSLHMNDTETFYAKTVSDVVADTVMAHWYTKLGNRMEHLLQRATQKKICCIVDDDTADTESVNLFKAACDASGIKGTLACLTYNFSNDSNLKDTLLGMEQEGFQTVLHAFSQIDEWIDPDANAAVCESNLVRGMQEMASAGFLNFKYWVTPYCKDTEIVQRMARKWGMHCILAGGNGYEPADDTYGRYAIRRCALGPDDASSSIPLETLKQIAQEAAQNNGWLIVMTHFETWKQESGGAETITPVWTEGQYVLYTSGTVMDSSAYALTDYIDVSGYDTVNVLTKLAGNAGICLYDADQNYITGYQPSGLTEIDVSEASYLRVSCWHTSGSFGLEDVVIQGVVSSGSDYTRFTELVDYLKALGYEFMTVSEAWSYRKAIYDVFDMF